jgi:hypothetical protein
MTKLSNLKSLILAKVARKLNERRKWQIQSLEGNKNLNYSHPTSMDM